MHSVPVVLSWLTAGGSHLVEMRPFQTLTLQLETVSPLSAILAALPPTPYWTGVIGASQGTNCRPHDGMPLPKPCLMAQSLLLQEALTG